MLDDHYGAINVAKHRIELHRFDKTPGHLAPYQPGFKTKEFEWVEIDKSLAKSIIDFLQGEFVTPIKIVSKKDLTPQICEDICKLNAKNKRDPNLGEN